MEKARHRRSCCSAPLADQEPQHHHPSLWTMLTSTTPVVDRRGKWISVLLLSECSCLYCDINLDVLIYTWKILTRTFGNECFLKCTMFIIKPITLPLNNLSKQNRFKWLLISYIWPVMPSTWWTIIQQVSFCLTMYLSSITRVYQR